MSLRDIEAAVTAYKKLTPEERALFNIEAGRRRKKAKRVRRVKARHVQEDTPAKPPKQPRKVGRPRKQPVDPLAQVALEG